MVEFLYEFVNKRFRLRKRLWRVEYKIGKVMVNLAFPIFYKFFHQNGVDEKSKIIVSLTSFPDRIETVWMTIVSLLRQTHKPQKVILWLSKEQFEGINLPRKLVRLEKYGLTIRWCDDLKPHKKYYYCMQEYCDNCIVIADDDVFYPENHLALLWQNYLLHPNCIIANKTHHIEYGSDGSVLEYDRWGDRVIRNPSLLLIPIGCNGVLYPPRLLNPIVFNKGYILNNVLYTDDLWLKACAVLSNVETYSCIKNELVYFDCIKASKFALWRTNTMGESRNNIAWNTIIKDFPVVDSVLKSASKEEKLNGTYELEK